MKLVYISGGDAIPPVWLEALNGQDIDDILPCQGIDQLRGSACDVVVVSLPLDGWSAEDLLEQIQREHAGLPVIIHDPKGYTVRCRTLDQVGRFSLPDG